MKKYMVFLLVLMFTLTAVWSQGAMQKYAKKMVKKKVVPAHMVITHPTQNYVYYLPEDVKIKVKLIRPADVLFHVHSLDRSSVKKKLIEAKTLRKARDGSYRGAVTFVLRVGKYHVIAAPQTNLGKDSKAAGPAKFSVRLKLKPIPIKKR